MITEQQKELLAAAAANLSARSVPGGELAEAIRAALEELDNPAAKLSDEAMNKEFSRLFNAYQYGETPELDVSFNRTYHVWRLAFDSARAILASR